MLQIYYVDLNYTNLFNDQSNKKRDNGKPKSAEQ